MLSFEEARQRVIESFSPLASEIVPVGRALGRVLVEDVTAQLTMPRKDVSAMDGYAVRGADIQSVPCTLEIIGELAAGTTQDFEIGLGQCTRIFTGAPLPTGADTILIQENTKRDGDSVQVLESCSIGRYVRKAGLDFSEGSTLATKGHKLTVRDLAVIAAGNNPTVSVHRRPRVAILSTGDEIVEPGAPMHGNQIVSSNSITLTAMVEAAGAEAINLGIAQDNRESLAKAFRRGLEADLLVTTGGASVGEHDLVKPVLAEFGLELDFWKIAMRPGKPLIFGAVDGTGILGLPGNPVSSYVCGLLFMIPAINAMMGIEDHSLPFEPATLGGDIPANDQRLEFMRARLSRNEEGQLVATPFSKQDSSMLSCLAASGCLIMRPVHGPAMRKGSMVSCIRLD
jgi:molybdopterin molybdotransferase